MTKPVYLFLIIFFLCYLPLSVKADSFFDNPVKKKGIIVIDPGHGGSDYGNHGKNNLYEKNINLSVSKLILKELEKNYEVHLTRKDDFKVSLLKRTSIANSKKADVFISIHTGGSLNPKASGKRIIFYSSELKPVNSKKNKISDNISNIKKWDNLQLKHVKESFVLAKDIKKSFGDKSIIITGARLFVLKGADMPSVLIEIGFQTNAGDAGKLSKDSYIERMALDIAKGIDFFLKKEKKIIN